MTTLSLEARDKLHALTWYMTARKTALRAALSFRTPLTVVASDDMRVQYSAYFQNLISATELLREDGLLPSKTFETELYQRFVFPAFGDGESNYEYVKCMRNAIIHRGYNIAGAAHIDGDFPMLVAEPSFQNNATNPAKIKTFPTFEKYVLDIITKCESVIGSAIFDCLDREGVFQATVDSQAAVAELRAAVQNSHVMPDWAKAMSATSEVKPEWLEAAHISMKDKLRAILAPCDTSRAP